jgi:hypothetical protein
VFTTTTEKGEGHQILREIVNEAIKKGSAKDHGKTIIYINSCGDWKRFAARPKRPWESVILPVTSHLFICLFVSILTYLEGRNKRRSI